MTQPEQQEQWLKHALRQAPWRRQTQATSLVMSVVVFVVVVGALYLAQASRTAAAGRQLQVLEAQRQLLEQENAQLRAEIASQQSVPRLMHEAEALGYHVATVAEVEYLTIENPPPVPQPTAPLVQTVGDLVPSYDETLKGWLQTHYEQFRDDFRVFWRRAVGREPADDPSNDLPNDQAVLPGSE